MVQISKKICFKKVNFWDLRGPLELLVNPKMAKILDSEPLLTLKKIETWAGPVPSLHCAERRKFWRNFVWHQLKQDKATFNFGQFH